MPVPLVAFHVPLTDVPVIAPVATIVTEPPLLGRSTIVSFGGATLDVVFPDPSGLPEKVPAVVPLPFGLDVTLMLTLCVFAAACATRVCANSRTRPRTAAATAKARPVRAVIFMWYLLRWRRRGAWGRTGRLRVGRRR